MFLSLTAPDPRICPVCHGMGFYYVETPGRNKPLEAVLRQCQRPHADKVMVQGGTETAMFVQPAATMQRQEATR